MIPVTLAQQSADDQAQPRYRIDVDAVLFELPVTDSGGQPIADLSEANFEVLQNNKLQLIVLFDEFSSRPLSLAILLDVGSAMSEENVRKGKQLIFDLLHVLSPEDQVLIGLYSDFEGPGPEWKQEKKGDVEFLANLTTDRYELLRAIENLTTGDRTLPGLMGLKRSLSLFSRPFFQKEPVPFSRPFLARPFSPKHAQALVEIIAKRGYTELIADLDRGRDMNAERRLRQVPDGLMDWIGK